MPEARRYTARWTMERVVGTTQRSKRRMDRGGIYFQKARRMENRLETRRLQDRLSELRAERWTVGKKKNWL